MAKTTKRYLLPSEVEGVLRSETAVYTGPEPYLTRYTFSQESGLVCEYSNYGQSGPWLKKDRLHSDDDAIKRANDDLTSFFCYVMVSGCECSRPCGLDGKCDICDDVFPVG